VYRPLFRNRATLPTGNWSPALLDLETDFYPCCFPFPPFAFPAILFFLLCKDSPSLNNFLSFYSQSNFIFILIWISNYLYTFN
jgi:hypothetical protein